MRIRLFSAAIMFVAASGAQANLLSGKYEPLTYEQAIAQVKGQPGRHVMLYFGMYTGCPPCNYVRNILNGSEMADRYSSNYAVVEIDIRNPARAEDKNVIKKFGAKWAPTLVFLDSNGKKVMRLPRGFNNEKEAILLNEFVSRKLYAKTYYHDYVKANFNNRGTERIVPETRVAKAAPVDDRPRLRDVLAQSHERVSQQDLGRLLPGTRMQKENQDWFLTLDLAAGGTLAASGSRKDFSGTMNGKGTWEITPEGKFCIAVKAKRLDEQWCRHVFRVGEGYFAVKELRENVLAYRFSLEKPVPSANR